MSKTCKRCGVGGFHWEELDSGWRLHDRWGKLHECTTLEISEQPVPKEYTDYPEAQGLIKDRGAFE
jgi:hypothetical protein